MVKYCLLAVRPGSRSVSIWESHSASKKITGPESVFITTNSRRKVGLSGSERHLSTFYRRRNKRVRSHYNVDNLSARAHSLSSWRDRIGAFSAGKRQRAALPSFNGCTKFNYAATAGSKLLRRHVVLA